MPKTAIAITETGAPAPSGAFSYEALPVDQAKLIRKAGERIRKRITRQIKDIIETGNDLLKIKEQLDHGQFEAWLDFEFKMTARSAQRYMRAAEYMADKNDIVSVLEPGAVYLLAAKSCPEEVRLACINECRRAKPGDLLKADNVRDLISFARDEDRKDKEKERRKTGRRKGAIEREERERKKGIEKRDRRDAAAAEKAREIAEMLVNKLSAADVALVHEALDDWCVSRELTKALAKATTPDSDNVTVLPQKPREKKTC